MGLTFRRFLNPCEHPVPVPGDTLAEVWGNKKSRCGGGRGHCDLSPSCRARPSPRRSFSITGSTWPPFLPITLTLPSRAPQLCRGSCTIFFPSQGLCFCRTSNSPDVAARSTEHILETLVPGLLSIPSLSQERQTEHSMKPFLLGAGNKGQKCGAVNLPAVAVSGVSSACSTALVTAVLW